jgi:hypothetical protein
MGNHDPYSDYRSLSTRSTRGRQARRASGGFESRDLLLQHSVLLVQFNHVQGEFFDLHEQFDLHLGQAYALLLNLLFGRDLRQAAIRFDIRTHLAQRAEMVARPQDMVRPARVRDHDVLRTNRSIDCQLVLG